MNVRDTGIPGAALITRRIFRDRRGLWSELFQRDAFAAAGLAVDYIQDSVSVSGRGVLRGLHFQQPGTQTKLITVVAGAIYDVCVDVRRGSPAYGKWFAATLSEENGDQLLIPAGCAHGFLGLEDRNVAVYKIAGRWMPESEHTIIWNDAALGIDWPVEAAPIMSEKDEQGVPLSELVARNALPSFDTVR